MSAREAIRGRQNAAFAEFLTAEMARRGMNYTELTRRMGVKISSSLRDVFSGKSRAAPKTIERIAKALELDPGVLAALYLNKPPKLEAHGEIQAHPKVEVTAKPSFALTMAPDGKMRLALDLPGIPIEVALHIIDALKGSGLFTTEVVIP